MIRPYAIGDMWAVLPHIREAEIREALALGVHPETNMRYGIEHGETVTLELDGRIVGIAGVVSYDDYAVPWSVFSDEIEKRPIAFLRACKVWLSLYSQPMMNLIDADNTRAQKWLQWLGFTLGETEAINGHVFRRYWRL